jgi:hypothetical protein
VFFTRYSWAKPVGGIAGFVLLALLIQTPYFIAMHFETGKSLVRAEPAARSLVVSDYSPVPVENPGLIGGGRRNTSERDRAWRFEAKWEIKTFFTIFNDMSRPALLYDMHARSYCRWSELIPDISLTIKGRQEVTLGSENSILHEGKVFEIDGGDNMSFSLSLDVSRYPGNDWTMVVFGIFTDFHETDNRGAICVPVNCVFCFLNLPPHASNTKSPRIEAFHVNPTNIVQLWRRHYLDPAWRRVMKVIDTSLEMQLSSLRRHV